MGKVLQNVFKAVVNEILQTLTSLGESGSEVSYLLPEPRNVAEVTRLSDDISKPRIKATLKEINNLINNHNFLVQEPEKGEPVTPCMDVYKAKTKYDGSLDKLKLRIVVIVDLQNKSLIVDTWLPIASTRNLKYFLSDDFKNKAIFHQL